MRSKVEGAVRILTQHGPDRLIEEMAVHTFQDTNIGDRILYDKSLKKVRERKQEEDGIEDILDTVLEIEPGYGKFKISATQLREEIQALAELVSDQQPRTILEVGTSDGGTFYIWSRYIGSAEQIVSIDLPEGRFGGGYDDSKKGIYESFSPSKKLDFVRANSHDETTRNEVSSLVNDSVDFLFIDADHSYEGAKQDFEMYKSLVSEGGIIAFHDIVDHPNTKEEVLSRQNAPNVENRHIWWTSNHPDCNVDELWTEIVQEYETTEFISHPKQTWGGIGVVHL